MRGLYAVPTRQRRSTWFLVDGSLRLYLAGGGDSFRLKRLELRDDSGSAITLLDQKMRGARQHLTLLWQASAYEGAPNPRQVEIISRLLLRHIERAVGNSWDLLVSPRDGITISIANVLVDHDAAGYETLIERLRHHARPVGWPDWIPDDEHIPEPDRSLPPGADPELWEIVRKALIGRLRVEQDQVFFNVDLAVLEIDSIDMVMIVFSLEESLGIEIPEEVAETLVPYEGPAGLIVQNLQALLDPPT